MFRNVIPVFALLFIVTGLAACGPFASAPASPSSAPAGAAGTATPAVSPTPAATATPVATPTSLPPPTSAATEAPRSIQDVSGGLDKLKSYRAHLSANIDGTNAAGKAQKGTWDYLQEAINGPNDQHLRFTASGDLAPTPAPTPAAFSGSNFDLYRVGGSSFAYNPSAGICQFLGTTDNPAVTRAILRPSDFIGGVADARLVRRGESQNGVSADHYAFTKVNSTTFKNLTSVQGDVWIAQDGGFIVKLTATAKGSTTVGSQQIDGTFNVNYDVDNINQVASITLPQGCVAPKLAADVPLPTNITDQQFFSQGGVTVLNFKTTDDISVVAAFFTKNLPAQGWTAGRASTTPALITLNFSKGSARTLTINIVKTAAGSTVTLQDKGGQ